MPPKMPSILPTLRPLFSPFVLMCTHSALKIWPRVDLPLMPVIAERAAEHDTGLKRPMPFFFLALGFLAFLAFFALGFFAAFFAGFFFFAAVCVVRARLLVIARFTTVVSVSTTASSNTIVRESNA